MEKVCIVTRPDKRTTATHSLNIAINLRTQAGKIFLAAAKMQWIFFLESRQRWEKEEFSVHILGLVSDIQGLLTTKRPSSKKKLKYSEGLKVAHFEGPISGNPEFTCWVKLASLYALFPFPRLPAVHTITAEFRLWDLATWNATQAILFFLHLIYHEKV